MAREKSGYQKKREAGLVPSQYSPAYKSWHAAALKGDDRGMREADEVWRRQNGIARPRKQVNFDPVFEDADWD